ncbi:hypothetical protein ABZY19_36770 [Streptomyces sp. NPDC006475]|uniref:hypothetical protein n=1 Tax=Streptomyces sp. NPDC006475 TaxID=3155719 RepID=UPI0033A8825F
MGHTRILRHTTRHDNGFTYLLRTAQRSLHSRQSRGAPLDQFQQLAALGLEWAVLNR